MPAQTLVDLSGLDLTRVVIGPDEMYRLLPHRHEALIAANAARLDATFVREALAGLVPAADPRVEEFEILLRRHRDET